MAANMTAFGHISDTEVTFLEMSAVIVIQVKTYYVNLLLLLFIGTSQITFHIYHDLDYCSLHESPKGIFID